MGNRDGQYILRDAVKLWDGDAVNVSDVALRGPFDIFWLRWLYIYWFLRVQYRLISTKKREEKYT